MGARMRFYYLLSIFMFISGHIHADERKISADSFNASVFEAANHAEYLHRININDTESLKSNLQKDIAIDVKILWSTIQSGGISDGEKSRAYGVLRLIAVQNEKFPNPALNSDKDIGPILQAALAFDQQKTEEVRSRNWSKPMWVK